MVKTYMIFLEKFFNLYPRATQRVRPEHENRSSFEGRNRDVSQP